MKVQKKIKVSLSGSDLQCPVKLVAADTAIQLVLEYIDFIIPDGTTATLFVMKPSKKFVYQTEDIIVDGNTVTINVKNQAIIERGKAYFTVTLTNGDDKVSTFSNYFDVDRNYSSLEAEESKTIIGDLISEEMIEDYINAYLTENPAITDEQLGNAISAYFAKNPITGGSVSADQIAQIEKNKSDIGKLSETIADKARLLTNGVVKFYKTGETDKELFSVNLTPIVGTGDGINTFITPEQYGAVGDGVTDDTQAFKDAIETGKPIVCDSSKTYKFTNEIVTRKTILNINGNHCTFDGFRIKINLNDAEDNWYTAYPQPCSVIENIKFDCNAYDWCIKTGIPLKMKLVTAYNCDSFLKNYGDYMDYMVLEDVNIFYAKNNKYPIELAYLGDQHIFRNCHSSGGTDDKFIQISGCNSARFESCLNGHYMIYASTAKFVTCHFENEGTVECGDGNYINSNISFDSCFFWDKYRALNRKGVKYENCTFMCTFDVIGQGLNDYLALDTMNCIVMCNTNGTTAQSHVFLDEYKRNVFDEVAWSGNKVVHSHQLHSNSGKNWGDEVGNYTYTFFPSSNPFSIEYSNFDYSKAVYDISVNSDTSGIQFNLDTVYKDMWVHCYRKTPTGKIQKCVLKVVADRMYDYGFSMNGILWKTVDSVPNPKTTDAIYRNGIYYSTSGANAVSCICTNIENGTTVYIKADGTEKVIGGSGEGISPEQANQIAKNATDIAEIRRDIGEVEILLEGI